jgi:geranylgeranyl pyrophosphate synthase
LPTTSEEGLHRDLKAGRLTLPYLYLYAHGDQRLKGILKNVFDTGRLSAGDVKILDEGLKACGSFSHCKRRIASYVAKAVENLKPLRENHYRKLLEAFAHHFTGVKNPV